MNKIRIIIGSWGSYNACNQRALGSKWLDFDDYNDWDEIVEELKKEGFDLDGIDEELFVQDIEGIPREATNWDYCNPKTLFETIKDSDILYDDYKYKVFEAFLEVKNWDDFQQLVEKHGSNWDNDICLYEGYDWEKYGREMFNCSDYEIPDEIVDFIDFEDYGRYMGGHAETYSQGIIEIR